ncbi:LIC_10190 family membrane protein [Gloeobacter kilaueensis]|uniref:DUF8201 domain-containing protein n=1 Tax=Gloeobacter kilaueensis (strain ATCC BAA-2537 / CCAP 1431/1 / ULC 316 / JS1) TaxID=1183438 RepID=U5QRV1_GLOK1|nr:hypothetical protein [Gloeobacter kilaueensis]AGY60420.1 hypothetical protein GKIL_4174 [Gloeobacter kilaueensis JS1]
MITIVLSWIYIGILSGLYGWLILYKINSNQTRATSEIEVPLSVLPLVGLAVIASLTGYLSLGMPIAAAANLLVLLFACGFSWVYRRAFVFWLNCLREQFAATSKLFLLMPGILLGVLALTSLGKLWLGRGYFNYDSGLYHVPSIHWIEQYGVVPGLGNLLAPLAVDSLWFLPCALFSFSWLIKFPLHNLLGLVAFCSFCFALGGFDEMRRSGCVRASSLFRLFLVVPLLELIGNIASPTTDEPAAILTLVTLALVCRCLEQQVHKTDTRVLQAAIAIVALFAVAIKWSVLPLLLPIIYLAYRQFRLEGRAAMLGYFLLGLGMLLPKLIRSVILSGYLVYPLAAVDLFTPDWKMPRAVVLGEQLAIAGWARMQFKPPAEVLAGGYAYWFPSWWANFRATPVAQFLLVALLLFVLTGLLHRAWLVTFLWQYGLVYITIAAGLVYWFLNAPFLRFGYGFVAAGAIGLVLPGAVVALKTVVEKKWLPPTWLVAAVVVALVLLTEVESLLLGSGVKITRHYLETIEQLHTGYLPTAKFIRYQETYPAVAVQRFTVRNLQIYRPDQGQQCWYAPLPCTPYLYYPIEGRGSSLKAGFRARFDLPGIPAAFDGMRFVSQKNK